MQEGLKKQIEKKVSPSEMLPVLVAEMVSVLYVTQAPYMTAYMPTRLNIYALLKGKEIRTIKHICYVGMHICWPKRCLRCPNWAYMFKA